MRTENLELMRLARKSLDGKWAIAIGTYLIYLLILVVIQTLGEYVPGLGMASLLVSGPLMLGISIFSLNIWRNEEANVMQLFDGFQNFVNAMAAYLLIVLFVVLWTLLLIVPGIIAGISYSMTFFIMADDPKIGPMDAIDKSKAMMEGYKMKYFRLSLRIFGLALLCILTLGIGFFFLFPYTQVLLAAFYEDIKNEQVQTVSE